jgi:hypothetical protein
MNIHSAARLLAFAPLAICSIAFGQDSVIECPTGAIQTDVTSSLPDGWWSTPQGGKLSGTEVMNIGGKAALVCKYKTTSTIVSVMRDAPSGMGCSAAGNSFRCRPGYQQGGSAAAAGTTTVEVAGQAKANVPVVQKNETIDVSGKAQSNAEPKVRTGGTCPDLALTGVEILALSRDPQGQYFFRLAATVENRGGVDFRSARGQQWVDIGQVSSGGSARRIGQFDFDTVASRSDNVVATYDVLRWRTSDEFPPSFRFTIVFGPDISADGNTANDDCTATNNSTMISGEDINSIIGGSGI